jgi:hypothetical protein
LTSCKAVSFSRRALLNGVSKYVNILYISQFLVSKLEFIYTLKHLKIFSITVRYFQGYCGVVMWAGIAQSV